MKTLNLQGNWMFEKLENRQLMSSTFVDESGNNAYPEDSDEDVSEDEEDSLSRVMCVILDKIGTEIKKLFMYALRINIYTAGRLLSLLGEQVLQMEDLFSCVDFRKFQSPSSSLIAQRVDGVNDADGEPMEWAGKSCILVGAVLQAIAIGMQADELIEEKPLV